MYDILQLTNKKELVCTRGYILRKREWSIKGIEGCFSHVCPNPLCLVPKRSKE